VSETSESEYLTIARIRKVWGRRGEVAAEILTDFPERFQAGAELLILRSGSRQALPLEGARFHKGLITLKFRGFDSISEAEALVGGEVQIPFASRMPLPPGEVYLSDLVGCAVLEDGRLLGQVESVQDTGAAPLLRVLDAEGELLIPFVEDICRTIDVAAKQIHVRLPEGLQELNKRAPER